MREIVASGAGIGFVSEAEFGNDPRLSKIPIDGPPMLMDEALICLTERSEAATIRAFLGVARSMAQAALEAGTRPADRLLAGAAPCLVPERTRRMR